MWAGWLERVRCGGGAVCRSVLISCRRIIGHSWLGRGERHGRANSPADTISMTEPATFVKNIILFNRSERPSPYRGCNLECCRRTMDNIANGSSRGRSRRGPRGLPRRPRERGA